MSDHLFTTAASIALAVIGLALVAVLVSRNANTAGVISAAAGGLSTAIGAATAPVSGGFSGGLSFPTSFNTSW